MRNINQKRFNSFSNHGVYLFSMVMIVFLWGLILYADLTSTRGLISVHSTVKTLRWTPIFFAIPGLIYFFHSRYHNLARKTVIICIFCSTFLVSELIISNMIWDSWTEMTIAEGNRIITSLHRFHEDQGYFPTKLIQLIPDYMPTIPKLQYTFRVEGFQYEPTDDSFLLLFHSTALTHYEFDSSSDSPGWVETTN